MKKHFCDICGAEIIDRLYKITLFNEPLKPVSFSDVSVKTEHDLCVVCHSIIRDAQDRAIIEIKRGLNHENN